MNYHTDTVNFLGGREALIGEGRLLERGAYFENLTLRGALFREVRLSVSGRSLNHLRYS